MSAEHPWAVTHEGCPSELTLDRLHAGELSAADARTIHVHVESCARCRSRAALRDAGLTAFPALDAERMIDAIHERVDRRDKATPHERTRSRRLRAGLAVAVSTLACAAAVLLALRVPNNGRSNELDEIRTKGGLGLRVFREHAGRIEESASGDRFSAGDRLRFGVIAPADFQIMIVGVEDRGAMFTYYPSDGSKRSRAPVNSSDGALAGAIELDQHRGREWIHLVACPTAFSAEDLQYREDEIEVPSGCASAAFQITKE